MYSYPISPVLCTPGKRLLHMTTLKYIKYEPYFLFTCSLEVFCQQLLHFSGSRNSENPHSFLEILYSSSSSGVRVSHDSCVVTDWDGLGDHDRVRRQLSVSSDSKLLDEVVCEEARVILRPKKPPRPKSEVFLNKDQQNSRRRTKRFSAFGVSPLSPINSSLTATFYPVVSFQNSSSTITC